MIPSLLALACANADPVIEAVNGVAVEESFGARQWPGSIAYAPGEDVVVTVEVRDPEGGPVSLWWPRAPEGFSFAPDAREGVWHVPEDPPGWLWLTLIAEDAAEPPGAATLDVAFDGPGTGDTGWAAPPHR